VVRLPVSPSALGCLNQYNPFCHLNARISNLLIQNQFQSLQFQIHLYFTSLNKFCKQGQEFSLIRDGRKSGRKFCLVLPTSKDPQVQWLRGRKMKFKLDRDKTTYRIRFQLNGKRKTLYLGTSDELDALIIQRQMETDWQQGKFDFSLKTYKFHKPKVEVPDSDPSSGEINPKLLSLWDQWVSSLDISDFTKNNHYHCCRVMISRADSLWDDVTWFTHLTLSSSTWNTRRRFITSCIAWAIEEALINGKNPWTRLKSRRESKADHANPFTKEEIQQILEAFESDRYCSIYSHYKHSHYLPFLKFCFLTAARPGEAIALQWKHIDFKARVIHIAEALGRDLAHSPYTTRKIRKETKTGVVNCLPMSRSLLELLLKHKSQNAKPDDLVFPGQKGGVMDLRSFREIWKKILSELGLEYRNPYQTRHTCLSFIAENHGLSAAAKVAGHKSLHMVSKHYVRFVGDLKDVMPDL
jgi:integrase